MQFYVAVTVHRHLQMAVHQTFTAQAPAARLHVVDKKYIAALWRCHNAFLLA